MNKIVNSKSFLLWILALIAIVFGVMTIKSAYLVLFTTGTAHQAAGNYVPFVVWFNGVAGFFYIVAGFGLWRQKRWALSLAIAIAVATCLSLCCLAYTPVMVVCMNHVL